MTAASLGADGFPRTKDKALKTELPATLLRAVRDFEASKVEHTKLSKLSLGKLDKGMIEWTKLFEVRASTQLSVL